MLVCVCHKWDDITAEGDEADAAVEALAALVANKFDEEQ